jgi:hypothetical protein
MTKPIAKTIRILDLETDDPDMDLPLHQKRQDLAKNKRSESFIDTANYDPDYYESPEDEKKFDPSEVAPNPYLHERDEEIKIKT